MAATLTLNPDERMAAMRPLQLFGQGKKPLPEFVDNFADLRFEVLDEQFQEADKAAAEKPGNTAARIRMQYAFALQRDAHYTYAGRRFLFALALNNDFRNLYDGAKSATDAGL